MFLEKLCFEKMGNALVRCGGIFQNITRVAYGLITNETAAPIFVNEIGQERKPQEDNSGKIAVAVVGGIAAGIFTLWICCHHGSTIIKQAGKLCGAAHSWCTGAGSEGQEDATASSYLNVHDEGSENYRMLTSSSNMLSPSHLGVVQSPHEERLLPDDTPPSYYELHPSPPLYDPPPSYQSAVGTVPLTGVEVASTQTISL